MTNANTLWTLTTRKLLLLCTLYRTRFELSCIIYFIVFLKMNTVPFDGEFRFLRNCSMPERKEHYELKDRVQYEHAVTKLTADLVDVRNDHGGIVLVNSMEGSGNLSKSQRV